MHILFHVKNMTHCKRKSDQRKRIQCKREWRWSV